MRAFILLLVCIVALHSQLQSQIAVEQAFPKLTFNRPVDIQHPADGSGRLFVVEQDGVIQTFRDSTSTTAASVFLDISARVAAAGNEMGLLGLAFHPDYRNNGFFFVNYTATSPLRTVVSRFRVSSADPNVADTSSEEVLLTFNQPYENHNGGQIAFGPDGFLYIATGDGGSGGDPQRNGQNRSTLLGKILRIDVNGQTVDKKYRIPADNPFVNNTQGFREEIHAWGLRNPWRFSFDPATGVLWAGDVGQSKWEEIDIIEKGKNYGWNIMEGNHCYSPATGCDTTDLVRPIAEYTRSAGYSVTGGAVYHGARRPELVGAYIYADYGSGRIWGLRLEAGGAVTNTELLSSGLNISTFGTDTRGEMMMGTFNNGKIYRFVASPTSTDRAALLPASVRLEQGYPHPASVSRHAELTIRFSLSNPGTVRLAVEDVLGREVAVLVQGGLSAGSHAYALPLAEIVPGTYYSTLWTDGVKVARPFVIER